MTADPLKKLVTSNWEERYVSKFRPGSMHDGEINADDAEMRQFIQDERDLAAQVGESEGRRKERESIVSQVKEVLGDEYPGIVQFLKTGHF